MAADKDPIETTDTMRQIRSASRCFAGMWFAVAAFLTVSGIVKMISSFEGFGSITFIFWVVCILVPAGIFWKAPDWMINRLKKDISDAINDPAGEILVREASDGINRFERMEIIHKETDEKEAPSIRENQTGQVLLDSTQRPVRLIFAGAFLVIGLFISLLIFLTSNDIGFFEVFFTAGWTVFCLLSMGFVYEIIIDKHNGTIQKKIGWFFIVFKETFELKGFHQVTVESTFYRQRHDSIRQRPESKDPKFKVDLAGRQTLNIKVFSHLTEAMKLGRDLSEYLELPFKENINIQR